MQQKSSSDQRQSQEEQIEAQKQQLLRQILTPEARQRLTNLKMIKPEFTEQLELQLIQEFITKHMKLDIPLEEEEEEGELPKLTISQEVNEKIWDRGIEKPPRKIRVRAAKDSDGNVTVYLAEGE